MPPVHESPETGQSAAVQLPEGGGGGGGGGAAGVTAVAERRQSLTGSWPYTHQPSDPKVYSFPRIVTALAMLGAVVLWDPFP